MATTKGRRAPLSAIPCLLLAAACGGNAESVADGAATADSAAEETTLPDSGGAEGGLAGTGEGEPGVRDGLKGAVPGEYDDIGGIGTEVPAEVVAPERVRIIRIPAGTRISVVAGQDISTAEYHAGDPVIATVIRDVRGPGGERLLPQGVRLLGRVKASAGSGGPGESPVLEIAFETLSAYSYERPVEGVVVNAPVVLDPAAARARRSASARVAAVTEVPGLIMAGTIIGVELRAPVYVPPFAAPAAPALRGDSVPEGDSAERPDSLLLSDTVTFPLEPNLAPNLPGGIPSSANTPGGWLRGRPHEREVSSKND